jgi:hypothetical protein
MARTTTTSALAVDLLPASDHTTGCCSPIGRAFCRWPWTTTTSTPTADLLLASDHDGLLLADRPRVL